MRAGLVRGNVAEGPRQGYVKSRRCHCVRYKPIPPVYIVSDSKEERHAAYV